MDAAYEGMQKRTFLPMAVLAGLFLPFLLAFMILYRKLKPNVQPQRHSKYSVIEDSEESDDSNDFQTLIN